MSQRFEGRNLEEALQNAAQALGVERHQVQHTIVVEKRGFLGGMKRVVLDAEVNLQAPAPAAPVASVSVPEVVDYSDAPPPREEATAARGARTRSPRGERDRAPRGGDRPRRGGGGRDRDRDRRPQYDDEDLIATPPQGEESEGAAAARAWCERVVSLAGLLVDVRSFESEQAITLRLFGRDISRFTEEHGELLDAVQVLANKALVGRSVPLPIELDCGEFKERREEDLAQRALKLADRVRRSGREELLPAMSPIERRIVHIALREDADVTTESRGEGFFKRVAIIRRPEDRAGAES
jgi:spoIIIJ-associated protein